MKIDALTIYSHPTLNGYFYDVKMQKTIQHLHQFLGPGHQLHLFPEATIKNNKLPNGILIKSPVNQTILMPSILRDPGCGFFLFKFNNIDPSQIPSITHRVMTFCQQLENMSPMMQGSLFEVINNGVNHLNHNQSTFSNLYFPIDLDCLYLDIDLTELLADLSQITNTLELKLHLTNDDLQQPQSPEIIGFIHTGSEYFPKAIHKKWFNIAAAYSDELHLSNVSEINNGFYGFPDHLHEAAEYQQWIMASMNYCIFKRWWIFSLLKDYLLEHMQLEITMVNDRCHAGLFVIQEQQKYYLLQSRGVQLLNNDNHPYLIAGQKESASYLVNNYSKDQALYYLGHGTSYALDESFNYVEALGADQSRRYLEQLKEICANTPIESEKCLGYNYNILAQKKYLAQFKLHLTQLYPLLNYQGRYLRAVML